MTKKNKPRFNCWINLRKSLYAGLLSLLPCVLLNLSLSICVIVFCLGALGGNVFDIIGFRKQLISSEGNGKGVE